jgi:hypothetical protein
VATRSLWKLRAQCNGIGDEGARAIGLALRVAPSLQRLYLGCNDIGPEGAAAIARGVPDGGTFRRLCLTLNPIGDEGAAHLGALLGRERRSSGSPSRNVGSRPRVRGPLRRVS